MTTPSGAGYTEFAARVGTEFALGLPDGNRAMLVLTECRASGSGSFSVTFKAGRQAPAEQAIFEVSADGFAPQPIFLVPIGRRPNDPEFPLEYQAIFNPVPVPGHST